MRVVVQRVASASVVVDGATVAAIGAGLMVLVGVEESDSEVDVAWLSAKLTKLRIFSDEAGVMNRSIVDVGGEVLAVSQFTLFASVKKGIYAANFAGGQVDITSGKFVFSASEAYMIENGKITYPVKGATLIGNGPDSMNKVGMIGNDMALDSGVGTCGKEGQGVPVGVGMPTIRIDGLTVGGTS